MMNVQEKMENFKNTGHDSIHFTTNDFKEFLRNVEKTNWSDFHSWLAEEILKEYISGNDKTEFTTWFELTLEKSLEHGGTGFDIFEETKAAFMNQIGFEFDMMRNIHSLQPCQCGINMYRRYNRWAQRTGNQEWLIRRNQEKTEWLENN